MRLAAFRSATRTLCFTPMLLMLGVRVAVVRAQEPRRLLRPDSVSMELAGALIGGSFGGEPQILAGAIPEWIASRIPVPSGAQVLGSAFLGTTMMAIFNVPSTSDSVLVDFRRALL